MDLPSAPNAPRSPCPHCGTMHDCALPLTKGESPVGNKNGAYSPKTGISVALCIHCGELNTYDEKLRLCVLSPMDRLRIELDPEAGPTLAAAQRAWRAVKAKDALQKPIMMGVVVVKNFVQRQ